MYAIRGLCHRTDGGLSRHGFSIDLSPEFRSLVADSGIGQPQIDNLLTGCGRMWLDACGFNQMFDPDSIGYEDDPKEKPGPNATPLYDVATSLGVRWGVWGPEHISVPGDACGLDIERSAHCCIFPGGVQLLPHNIDCLDQKYLLLIVFTEIVESLVIQAGK